MCCLMSLITSLSSCFFIFHLSTFSLSVLTVELMRACFELEKIICPHRLPSSTIAINRHAQFRPHRYEQLNLISTIFLFYNFTINIFFGRKKVKNKFYSGIFFIFHRIFCYNKYNGNWWLWRQISWLWLRIRYQIHKENENNFNSRFLMWYFI